MSTRVLIVEPDPALRASYSELLHVSGYDVVEARTFQEARRILRDRTPDLLVTEVRLAGFNGLQLIITSPKPVPSVVLSNEDALLRAETERLGAIFLAKPVSQAHLLVAIERQLARVAEGGSGGVRRRWIRKTVNSELRASIDDSPARVLDVSYGGLRVELERASEHPLPRTFDLKLVAAGLNVPADLIWISRVGDRSWHCGVALSRMGRLEASTWRGLVDMIP
jgi:DNA-binding response OmpR family regulator